MANQREILYNNKEGYQVGDLSWFPIELDDQISLYDTANNAISVLSGKLNVGDTTVKVYDNTYFPDQGIIRINDELIYYATKEDQFFKDLQRGFNGSIMMNHGTGSVVLGCVSSLHHNSLRDAILKCEEKTGLYSDLPDINGTLTSRVKYLDIKWFTPTARFFALPRYGRAPFTVNFRNMSLGEPYVEYSWDFGDVNDPIGNFSIEKHPVHVFARPGVYTITLQIKGSDGRNSSLSKNEYIKVFDNNTVYEVIAYARLPEGVANAYQALKLDVNGRPLYDNRLPFKVQFVDQTLGYVRERKWNFGDGNFFVANENPYEHTIEYTYTKSGVFWPELQVMDENSIGRTYRFRQPIVVGMESQASVNDIIYRPIVSENSLKRTTIGENYTKVVLIKESEKALIIG